MRAYTVSVGTGGCFPRTVIIRLRPTRRGVTVAAQENWRTVRRLRGRAPVAELGRFAAEVIARAAVVAAPEGRRAPELLVAGPHPWTRYELPRADGTVAEHRGAFSPALADWLSDWLDVVAAAPRARVWVPRPLPRTWLGRRLWRSAQWKAVQ